MRRGFCSFPYPIRVRRRIGFLFCKIEGQSSHYGGERKGGSLNVKDLILQHSSKTDLPRPMGVSWSQSPLKDRFLILSSLRSKLTLAWTLFVLTHCLEQPLEIMASDKHHEHSEVSRWGPLVNLSPCRAELSARLVFYFLYKWLSEIENIMILILQKRKGRNKQAK